jgi:glycosyltransferase involved in cell wall biosynthesis
LIEHEATGLLIERNPEALADALIRILSDPTRLREMGQEARRRAERRFSADVMVAQIEGLYGEMLGNA